MYKSMSIPVRMNWFKIIFISFLLFYTRIFKRFDIAFNLGSFNRKKCQIFWININVLLLYCHVLQSLLEFLIFVDNLSYKKVASQAHSYTSLTYFNASDAVDGNTETCTKTKSIGSTDLDKTVWWKVDLGGVHSIYSISILFKNYEGYGMYNYGICTCNLTECSTN